MADEAPCDYQTSLIRRLQELIGPDKGTPPTTYHALYPLHHTNCYWVVPPQKVGYY